MNLLVCSFQTIIHVMRLEGSGTTKESENVKVPVFKKVAEVKEKDADGGPSDIVSFAMVQMVG